MTTLVVLSTIAYMIRKHQDSDPENIARVRLLIQRMADRFTLDENWNKLLAAISLSWIASCNRIQSSMNRCFRARPMTYFFYEMPQDFRR